MADVKRCPVCFSRIINSGDPIADEALREYYRNQGIYTWKDDPLLTLNGIPGYVTDLNDKQLYSGITVIHKDHLQEIQDARKQQEIDAGIPTSERTEFSPIPESLVPGDPAYFLVTKQLIQEIRDSTEKILECIGITKEQYFNYDDEGNERRSVGDLYYQYDWIPPDLKNWKGSIQNIHFEDLRHPIPSEIPMIPAIIYRANTRYLKGNLSWFNWANWHTGDAYCHYYWIFYLQQQIGRYFGPTDKGCYEASGGKCAEQGYYGIGGYDWACGCDDTVPIPHCLGKFIKYSGHESRTDQWCTFFPGNTIESDIKLQITILSDARPNEIKLDEYKVSPQNLSERNFVGCGFLEDAIATGKQVTLEHKDGGIYQHIGVFTPTYELSSIKRESYIRQWDLCHSWATWSPAIDMNCFDNLYNSAGSVKEDKSVYKFTMYVPNRWDMDNLERNKKINRYASVKTKLFGTSYKAVQVLDETEWEFSWQNALTRGSYNRILTKTDGAMYLAEEYHNESYLFGTTHITLLHSDVIDKSATVTIRGKEWTRIEPGEVISYGPEDTVYWIFADTVWFGDNVHGKTPPKVTGTIQYCCKELTISKFYANGDIILADSSYPIDKNIYAGIKYYNVPNLCPADDWPWSLDMYNYFVTPDSPSSAWQSPDAPTYIGGGDTRCDYNSLWFWGKYTITQLIDYESTDHSNCPLPFQYNENWWVHPYFIK